MERIEKMTFFKRVKTAIFDLDNYLNFLAEKFSKCILFVIEISLILSVIFSIATISHIFIKYNSMDNYIDKVVPEFSITDGQIKIDDEKELTDEQKDTKYIIDGLNRNVDFNIIKDGYNKSDLKKDISKNINNVLIYAFVTIVIGNFFGIAIFWLFNAVMVTICGQFNLLFSRVRMRFSSIYVLAVYSSTLSTILSIVYSILRMYYNIYIDIFDYVYIAISIIYITAVILIIRSELMKQHVEIMKIVTRKRQDEKNKMENDNSGNEDKNKDDNKEPDDTDKEGNDLKEPGEDLN